MYRLRLEDGDLLTDRAGRYTGEFLPPNPVGTAGSSGSQMRAEPAGGTAGIAPRTPP